MNTTAEQRNAEVVSTLYSAFADRDIATALDTMAEDIEWHESDDLPWGGVEHGREAVAQHIFAAALEVIGDLVVTPDQILAAGDTVTVRHRYVGIGFLTHKKLEVPGIGVYDLADGKIVRYRQFVDGRQFVEVLLAHLAATQTTRDDRSPVRH